MWSHHADTCSCGVAGVSQLCGECRVIKHELWLLQTTKTAFAIAPKKHVWLTFNIYFICKRLIMSSDLIQLLWFPIEKKKILHLSTKMFPASLKILFLLFLLAKKWAESNPLQHSVAPVYTCLHDLKTQHPFLTLGQGSTWCEKKIRIFTLIIIFKMA